LVLDILPSTAYVLPINLRHLGYHFHGIYHDQEEGVRRLLYALLRNHERAYNLPILLDAARALPKLNLFTATRYSSQAVLEEIERWCREGGVEFVVHPEPGCFRRPRHVDWI
ncbi:hypothetical protein FA95DRAFT_1614406, partial [Auriscalpium vulgare]